MYVLIRDSAFVVRLLSRDFLLPVRADQEEEVNLAQQDEELTDGGLWTERGGGLQRWGQVFRQGSARMKDERAM